MVRRKESAALELIVDSCDPSFVSMSAVPRGDRPKMHAHAMRLTAAFMMMVALPTSGCATAWTSVGRTSEGADIVQIKLPISNAFLIKSKSPILIDVGSEGDMETLERALGASHTKPSDLGLVVLTHGHADHAGNMTALMKLTHAQIAMGEGDVALARRGHNDDLQPQNFTACFLQLFLPQSYPPFEPSIEVGNAPLDLGPWGVSGEVISMPGHTAGSLVVVLENHSAFVGDQILGGYLGGAIAPKSPGQHYFQADDEANRANITKLVRMGVQTFYIGHGGPVSRADVIKAFDLDLAPPT